MFHRVYFIHVTSIVLGDYVEESLLKHQLHQAQELLYASSKGKNHVVQRLLKQGCSPDACDYDKRTGLMLASANGHASIVSELLSAGANINACDNSGSNALQEAIKAGHLAVLRQLVSAGARIGMSDGALASLLCELVTTDQEALLQRYLLSGADVSVGDYDKRTALHVAAAEGKPNMVSKLCQQSATLASAVD